MGEDPADHPGILNGRDQAHGSQPQSAMPQLAVRRNRAGGVTSSKVAAAEEKEEEDDGEWKTNEPS
jgi:hypothetical protein